MNKFKNHINQNLSFLQNSKLLIAISGGVDSVVLAYLCKESNYDFALAHCNFNLRGAESDADEQFIVKLAETLGVEVFIQNFETEVYAKTTKQSIQMAARQLRYDWFNDLIIQLNFDYILTAHHADDNLETFLINLTRGTGLSGLTGIPEINDAVVRPLLPFSRKEIEDYVKEHSITWREDSSNSSRKYLRNKLRHEVIPILKELNPQVLESFKNTLENLNDTADIVDESLNAVAKRAIVDIEESRISYKVSEFKKVNNPKAYLFEMFKNYGFTEWNDVVGLLDAETGKYVKSSTHILTKDRAHLVLSDMHDSEQNEQPVLFREAEIFEDKTETSIGTFRFTEVYEISRSQKNMIFIDKDKLIFPLKLRKWQTEDVFYPFGMKGKKRVSKYLKDEKLSLFEKENSWVLTSNNTIVWVVGKRADERFRVEKNTKTILKIELETNN